jgi:hypothetical protein
MKKVLTLILVFLANNLIAQLKIWDKTLGSSSEDGLSQIINTLDGGIVGIGSTYQNITNSYGTYASPSRTILKKISSSGQLLWQLELPQGALGNSGVALKELNDGSILALVTKKIVKSSESNPIGDSDI